MVKNIEKLMHDNKKLVYYLYNKLPQTETCVGNKEDLISEGMIGLWKGCKSFDEQKGYKITSYLTRCINNEMYMYFRKLNKQPTCIGLDDTIATDSSNGKLTVADKIIVEEERFSFDLNDYVTAYFKHNKSSKKTKSAIPIIISMLANGETRTEIAKRLDMSNSTIRRYIEQLKEAIIKEFYYEQRN